MGLHPKETRIHQARTRLRMVGAATTLAILTGCSAPARESPPTSSFPNFDGFDAVDSNQYFQSRSYFGGIVFSTPDGLSCDHNAMNSLNDPSVVVLSCTGPRPDKGPGNWKVRVATDKAATLEQASSKPPEGGPYKLLPALHMISYEGILCGADDKGTTACRIGDHGFVLTPGETTLF